jgi:hypothetical protein
VLLHNAGAQRHIWDDQVAVLGRDHEIFALDLPGYGESDQPAEGYRLADYVGMIDAFLYAHQLTDVVVGNWVTHRVRPTAHLHSNRRPAMPLSGTHWCAEYAEGRASSSCFSAYFAGTRSIAIEERGLTLCCCADLPGHCLRFLLSPMEWTH